MAQELSRWFKPNQWTSLDTENVRIDTKKARNTNRSNRNSAVSVLGSRNANLQEVIKITDHSTPNSLKSYLKVSEQHNAKIINQIRKNSDISSSSETSTSSLHQKESLNENNVYCYEINA